MSGNGTNTSMVGGVRALGWFFLAVQMVVVVNGADEADKEKQPAPLALLQGVAQARQQITSGEMEMDVFSYGFDRPQDGTNHVRLKAVFDGEKRRFESFGREYRYVLMGPEADKVTDAKMRELGLDRAAAVRAGLLEAFESHHVTAYDGAVLMDYGAIDGKPSGTKIEDPAKGSSSYGFDPRVLGLTPSPFVTDTIERCLAHAYYTNAEPAQLIGKESVEGIAAWHVRIPFPKARFNLDFWIDASHPSHVVKCELNGNTVFSKFDVAKPEDPLPTEVRVVNFYGPERKRFEKRIVRHNARFNVPVDPASWTLAGFNMPVGTEVVDYRISRSIGYWNGSGLSENLPPRTTQQTTKPQSPPNPADLLALVEKDPKSPFALAAATRIILNTPDGPEVAKAAEVIRSGHLGSPDLIHLCQGLERLRHRCARELLHAVLENNPHAEVQAHACFALATLLKSQANETANQQAATEAERLFERVIAEYGQVKSEGKALAGRAGAELSELHGLGVGKVAPEIEGEDVEGQSFKLSDYRGKVVVIDFWGDW